MSDQDAPTPPPPPKAPAPPPPGGPRPQADSPTVPLKKETVRISLRANPGTGTAQPRKATAPIATSTAPSKTTVRIPVAPAPSAPGSPAPAKAAGDQSSAPPGARTAPLVKTAAPGVRPGAPAGATQELPQATVKLQRTQPLAKPGQGSLPVRKLAGAPTKDAAGRHREDAEAGLLPLSIVGFVVSLALLCVVLLGSNYTNKGEYLDLPELAKPTWQTQRADKTWIDQFTEQQLNTNPVPQR